MLGTFAFNSYANVYRVPYYREEINELDVVDVVEDILGRVDAVEAVK